MRYDDWDVLLFPSGRDGRVPLKEFKVNCHVTPDKEFSHNRGAYGLPVMTCFAPSLESGSHFHISIHCWGTPQISQYALNYSKHPELVKFEARILIDGRMVASTSFEPLGQWPHLITTTCEMSKKGELEPLKFPSFRRELLYQNHWNPADDIGRVKIIISEGFPRDSPSNPIERIKNVVVFAFQHAPLDILENNGIAWPNPQMWRRPQNNPGIPVPTYHPDDGADSHLHSPRRRSYIGRNTAGSGPAATGYEGSLTAETATAFNPAAFSQALLPTGQKSSGSSSSGFFMEPFSEAAYQELVGSLGLPNQQQTVEPKAIWPGATARSSTKHSEQHANMPYISDYLSSTIHTEALQVPTNTPTAFVGQLDHDVRNIAVSSDLATSLTYSLLNQPHPLDGTVQPHQIPLPASNVRSRKENRHLNSTSSVNSPSNLSPSIEAQIRKFSQTGNAFDFIGHDRNASGSCPTFSRRTSAGEFGVNLTNQATPNQAYAGFATPANASGSGSEKGTKRGRNFTPASARAIDEEDEPRRVSPRMRLTTATSTKTEGPIQIDE
ncbi:hypothetical protein M406DRAFT_264913 [Cryphonectria parasitica EP155]|uniref:Uncharacterized protein n=1 Tax=Cryphonectria parasitica (strain ATCC 38755 / EP155) TaxID=660469 RepID=A0A9P4XXH7_CRYP1|nr:uncharacterized protein M406DRAFT_264913 [Cryphonectria parasitica EP155]KAF3762721.1 hypothetical protein M406DRAFT_264913 [Cryphonectria parasitica EP155]